MKRTIKGWAFNKVVPSGLGNMPCVPFFKRKYMADKTAEDFIARHKIKIVPAMLTLDLLKLKKRARR